jgi:hypothetical protein
MRKATQEATHGMAHPKYEKREPTRKLKKNTRTELHTMASVAKAASMQSPCNRLDATRMKQGSIRKPRDRSASHDSEDDSA